MLLTLHAYRHDDLVIGRPYGIDVDEQGRLWEGCGDELVSHDLRTAELHRYKLAAMAGEPAFQCFCVAGKVVITLGAVPFYAVFDPATDEAQKVAIPGDKPIVWYGQKLVGDRTVLFDRANRNVLILDHPDALPRVVPCPWQCDLSYGSLASDGLIYIFVADPARLIRFDPSTERFIDEQAMPWLEVGATGRFEHDGVMYVADSSGGRLLPFDMATQQWGEPVATPGYGKVFGFIGQGIAFQNRGYFCLSTYACRSKLDLKTGKIIPPPPGASITTDGRTPRFLDRFLVFDPATKSFDYLIAPTQPDGISLMCYAWSDDKRLAITGTVLPFHEPGVVDAADKGAWLIVQSEVASEAPPLGPFDFDFDRDALLASRRRAYPADRSLYLPEDPHTPPIVNMYGPATQYPPGRDTELKRRVARTDAKAYWKDVADRLLGSSTSDADKVRTTLAHVKHQLFYNPTQVTQVFNAIAIHESHEGRCGHGVDVTLAIFEAAGIKARRVELHHHVVAEAHYDGKWHLADALYFGGDQPHHDGCVRSVDELRADIYFADAWPQDAMMYDPELLTSRDGFQVQGYVFGVWGSQTYYSYFLGAPKAHPPTLPIMLPAQQVGEKTLRLNWARSLKWDSDGSGIRYDVRVFEDRQCTKLIASAETADTHFDFAVPEPMRMYFIEVRATDEHRQHNPATWYPAARWNVVLAPRDQYGWYGVL